MRRVLLTCVAIALFLTGLSNTALAQDGSEVVILRFDTVDVDQEVMDQFYSEIHRVVQAQPEWSLGSGGDVTIQDLLLVAGCDELTADCLGLLQDFVAGDQILFGAVQRSDDVHMFSIRLFDFESGEFQNEVAEQTLRGDESWISQGIPAVIEHFIYGATASLQVDITGHPETEVRLNGELVGQGSTLLEGLSPGEVVVVVSSPDGEEQMDRAILRHDEQSTLSFEFEGDFSTAVEPPPFVAGRPSLLPGFALAGVGVAGLVVGIMGHSRLAATESEARSLVDGRSHILESQLSRAQELQDQMNSAQTMRVIGLSVGAVGVAAGGVMLFRALSGSGSTDSAELSAARRPMDIGIAPSGDGVSASIRLDF